MDMREVKRAKELIPQLEEELAVLRKRKTAFKGHGTSTKEITALIDAKQSELRKARRLLKQKIPANAYEDTIVRRKRGILTTKEAQKRPMQGGRTSPK